jgi:hypothetical protein
MCFDYLRSEKWSTDLGVKFLCCLIFSARSKALAALFRYLRLEFSAVRLICKNESAACK